MEKSFMAIKVCQGYMSVPVQVPADFAAAQSLENEPLQFRTNEDGVQEAHITLVSPHEFKNLTKKYPYLLEHPIFIPSDNLEYKGLGKVEEGGNAVYFTIVEWKSADLWREMHGLPPYGYHITLGFRDKDIHQDSDGNRLKKNERRDDGSYKYAIN